MSKSCGHPYWDAMMTDIDMKIERHQAAIRKLRSARKVAEKNLADHKTFPWAQMERKLNREFKQEMDRRKNTGNAA